MKKIFCGSIEPEQNKKQKIGETRLPQCNLSPTHTVATLSLKQFNVILLHAR
jgi:hypothetical protein